MSCAFRLPLLTLASMHGSSGPGAGLPCEVLLAAEARRPAEQLG